MPRIVVTDSTFGRLDHEQAVADRHGATLESFQCRTAGEVEAAVSGADAVLVQFAPMTEAALRSLKPGAAVVRYGVGFDNIDVGAARRLGHPVAYVPDYCIDEVADHTVAMLLSLYRRLPALDASVRDGKWAAVEVSRPLKPARQSWVGFFGFGRIGRAVLERLKPFGFRFLVCDPAMDEAGAAAIGVDCVSFETLLERVDTLLLHAPITDATRGIINDAALSRIKPGAMLVNSSRGGLVDEAALVRAMASGRVAAAALDVFEREPLPPDSPLREAPNLLLSPHAAWYSDAAIDMLQRLAAEEIDLAMSGQPPRRPVP